MAGTTGGNVGGLGGGRTTTDSGVCAISPSDLVGYTGNALNRLKELEQRVAELEAKNTEVNQLSDLSQQVGWVGGITYLGTAGWTQTAAGTLIPPPGVSLSTLGITMSDGNSYQMVVVNEDGTLTYGFTATGGVGGTLANRLKRAIFTGTSSTTWSASPSVAHQLNIGFEFQNDDGIATLSSDRITLALTGTYYIGWNVSLDYPVAAGSEKLVTVDTGPTSGSLPRATVLASGSTSSVYGINAGNMKEYTAGDYFYLWGYDFGTGSGTRSMDVVQVDVIYLGA